MSRSRKARKRKGPKWVPVLWEAKYRGATIWIDREYRNDPKWAWHAAGASDGEGRSYTADAAKKNAQQFVDDEADA